MPEKVLIPNRYVPTVSRGGNGAPFLFRGRNGFIRGRGAETYFECYGGSLNLNETIPAAAITGTLSFTTVSKTITGTSSAFMSELHLGQMLVTPAGVILNVAEIINNTSFVAHSFPQSDAANVAAYRMPILFEFDRNRGTLLSGNAFEADTGNILAVGSGTFRRNGQVLNSNLIVSKRAKIAIYDGANYAIYQLGFDTVPGGITLGATAAAVNKTYTDADVNTGADTITVTAHGFYTGQAVSFSVTGTLAAPLALGTTYYLIRVDANTLKIASSLQNAVGGTFLDLTTAGTGTTTVAPRGQNMPKGTRGLRFAKASTKTAQEVFGNPGENITVVTTVDGERIAAVFPAMDSNADPANLHDAWRVYSTFKDISNGVWYYVRTITAAELGGTAGGTYPLEYLDGELAAKGQLISFDNDAPCDAEYVASVTGYPVLVSCQGKSTTDNKGGSSPGVSIVPFKVNNLAAAPLARDSGARAEVPTSPPETIIGYYLAAGRLYLLTANSLPIAVFTADNDFPIATRPFWKTGFRNPYALCFVQGRLYGYTTSGAVRSAADGEAGSEEHAFASDVEEITKDWDASRVMVAHDPQNECVCFAYGGAYKNEQGFWVSIILPFMLRSESWSLPIIIESAERDMIISGLATVGGNLEFLAGGRNGLGGYDAETFRFDGGAVDGTLVKWQIAWSLSDDGAETRPKTVKYPRLTAKTTNASIGIFGATGGANIDVAAIESGNADSLTGAIAVPDSETVELKERIQTKVSQLSVYTLAVEGIWTGLAARDRVDELCFEVEVKGARK